MTHEIIVVPDGSVTTPLGFTAGATYAGIRTYAPGKVDLGMLFSETSAAAAGTYTKNKVVSPSVTVSKKNVARGVSRGVVVNSGCANCSVGDQGLTDAEEMAALAAGVVGVAAEDMAVSSTGLIGVELPMGLIRNAVGKIELTPDGGHDFARSIMTTDTVSKEIAVSFSVGDATVNVAGCCKGSGMIHPNMATMLAYLTTDAEVDVAFLQETLSEVVDSTFNMVDIDGDTSTNDTVLLFANGASGAAAAKGTTAGRGFRRGAPAGVHTPVSGDGEGRRRRHQAHRSDGRRRRERRRRAAGSPFGRELHPGEDGYPRQRPQLGAHHDGRRQERR